MIILLTAVTYRCFVPSTTKNVVVCNLRSIASWPQDIRYAGTRHLHWQIRTHSPWPLYIALRDVGWRSTTPRRPTTLEDARKGVTPQEELSKAIPRIEVHGTIQAHGSIVNMAPIRRDVVLADSKSPRLRRSTSISQLPSQIEMSKAFHDRIEHLTRPNSQAEEEARRKMTGEHQRHTSRLRGNSYDPKRQAQANMIKNLVKVDAERSKHHDELRAQYESCLKSCSTMANELFLATNAVWTGADLKRANPNERAVGAKKPWPE